MSKINLHKMFEARMNEQAETVFHQSGIWSSDMNYDKRVGFKSGYTAALTDLQGKVDGLLAALNEIKDANMPVDSLQYIAEEALADFYAQADKNGDVK